MTMRPQSVPRSFMTRCTQASSKAWPLSKQPENEKKGRIENEARQKHNAKGIDPFVTGAQDEKSCGEPRRVCRSNFVCPGGLLCAAESVNAIEQSATGRSNRLEASRAGVGQSGLSPAG